MPMCVSLHPSTPNIWLPLTPHVSMQTNSMDRRPGCAAGAPRGPALPAPPLLWRWHGGGRAGRRSLSPVGALVASWLMRVMKSRLEQWLCAGLDFVAPLPHPLLYDLSAPTPCSLTAPTRPLLQAAPWAGRLGGRHTFVSRPASRGSRLPLYPAPGRLPCGGRRVGGAGWELVVVLRPLYVCLQSYFPLSKCMWRC